jgi:site-specific DNA-methyltransferase (adenine-specific)
VSNWPEWTSPCGRIRCINADCLEVLPTLEAGSVDAVVTDPPYGIKHKSGGGTGGKWHNVRHQGVEVYGDDKPFDPTPWISLGVPSILWGANFYSDKLPGGGWLVWDKRRGIEGMRCNRSDSELAYFSGSKTVKTFRHLWHGICRDSEVGKHLHPTQKPIALIEWCLAFLPKANAILDPFAGSFTTAVACIRTNRRCIAIEKERKYFDIGVQRCKAELAKTALLEQAV